MGVVTNGFMVMARKIYKILRRYKMDLVTVILSGLVSYIVANNLYERAKRQDIINIVQEIKEAVNYAKA